MYIETALNRLNAFHQDTRCDVRFSFPTTYMDEPYAAYSWGEILQLVSLYPYTRENLDGKQLITVSELGILIDLESRTVLERRDGYRLASVFDGNTRIPVFVLSDSSGSPVYTRICCGMDKRRSDGVIIKGQVNEEWFFKGATGRQPKSLKQAYFIEDMPSGNHSRTKVGKVTITYTTEHNKVIEEGIVTYSKGFSSEYDYTRESYSVFDNDSLIVRHQPGNRVVCLLDGKGVVRKTYDGEFLTIVRWFDESGKPIYKGKFDFITHLFELKTSEVDNALRRSGASEFDDRYPSIESKFSLKCCPVFPVPEKGESDV